MNISDITGEQRKELTQAAKEISDFPRPVREAFLCEQLGLCFKKDDSVAMYRDRDSTRFRAFAGSWYVTGSGKITPWWEWWKSAGHVTEGMWNHAYELWKGFPYDYLLSFYPEEVEKLALTTAKYLLRTMPEEDRWMLLASIGNMLYNENGPYNRGREDWKLDGVVPVRLLPAEGRGYFFLDPEGREHDIRVVANGTGAGCWRWRWMVWRCENLVGSKDILALFPEEVKAMRKHFKERKARLKDETKAKNDALLVAADEGMSSLSKEKRLARVALAMGLYYLDHRDAGCTGGHLNPNTIFILPDGTKHRGEEFMDEEPGLLQQIPHEAILEFYRQPIEQMARKIAEARFKEVPPMLRDLLRALLSDKLIKFDGTPAKMKKDHWRYETFDRRWDLRPRWTAEPENTWFIDSKGNRCSFDIFKVHVEKYVHTIGLVCLCAQILGKEETVKLVPPGGGAALTPEQQRAWLAEKMGFCFTEDGGAAYQSERTANGNAVYVDAQGKVRKLSEVPGKDSAGWTEATGIALAVGYDKFTAPYKEELKRLAVQTSKHILASMSPELRRSWFAENNEFFFIPNAQISYATGERTLESGVKHPFYHGTGFDYGRSLYYDPSGKIVPTTAVGEAWDKRWWLLYYCEFVAGIDAINALFPAEVEPMRAAFQKSPFYKK